MYQHVGLIGKTICNRQPILTMHQRQPRARAVSVEFARVKRAVIEQITIGCAVFGVVRVARDKFINVFKARVVPGVNHHATVRGQCMKRALVCAAAECGALDRFGHRVVGINFNDPAEAVELVRMLVDIESFVELMPAIAGARPHTITCLTRVGFANWLGEMTVNIFFASKICAPWSEAIGAIRVGAQHFNARRVGSCPHQCRSACRTTDRYRRVRGNATCVSGRAHHFPLTSLALNLNDRAADGVLCFPEFFRRPGQHAIWIQQSLVKIFVVHDQQAMIGIVRAERQREKMHAIVMHARLHGLVCGAIGRIWFERWPIGYRIAPCKK